MTTTLLCFVTLMLARLAQPAAAFASLEHQVDMAEILDAVPKRFDYRLSFKPPYQLNDKTFPHFTTTGEVNVAHDFLRVVPSLPMRQGAIWSTLTNPHASWSVELKFSVSGRGNAGGEGLVFWYAKSNKLYSSPDFYGHSTDFTGYAIVFDTSDILNHRYNSFIYLVHNDGHMTPDHFRNLLTTKEYLGACYREYRNTPTPVYARISYINKTLSLDMDLRQDGKSYHNCFSADVPDLPTGYYFGVSASTDHMGADDHDVIALKTSELNPAPHAKKSRPFEEQDIKEGKKFEMNKEIEQEIEKAKESVHKIEEVGNPKDSATGISAVTPELIAKIEENQFHIIESLNHIEQALGQPKTVAAGHNEQKEVLTPSHQADFESRINGKFEQIRSDIDHIREEVRLLTQKSTEAYEATHRVLEKLDSKLQNAHEAVQVTNRHMRDAFSSNQAPAHHGSAVYYALYIFAGFSGIGMATLIVRAYTNKERDHKKFI